MSETPEELRARSLAKMSEVYGWEFQDGPGDFYGITAACYSSGCWPDATNSMLPTSNSVVPPTSVNSTPPRCERS